jgi:hypothetical protein
VGLEERFAFVLGDCAGDVHKLETGSKLYVRANGTPNARFQGGDRLAFVSGNCAGDVHKLETGSKLYVRANGTPNARFQEG